MEFHDDDDLVAPISEGARSYIAALLSRDDANEVMWRSEVEPVHVEDGELAAILEAMIAVRDRGERVHYLTVAEQLASERLEAVMWHVNDHWCEPEMVEWYAEQTMATYRRRSVKDLGLTLSELADTTPGPELDAEVSAAVDSLARPAVHASVETGASLFDRAFGHREHSRTLDSPWPVLDRAIRGFRKGGLYTLSGDTGSGKSALGLQVAHTLAESGPVAYWSMEMGEPELQDRLIAQQCAVSLDMVERQHFPDGPIRERVEAFARDGFRQMMFITDASPTVSTIRRAALSMPGLAAIVVDQLPLLDLGVKRGENLSDAIGRAVYGLKQLAVDLQIPVVMLTQLNREAARAQRPTRHHLYGSSAIANASDVILILYREDTRQPQDLSLIIDKNRQGEEGVLDLQWQGAFVRAVDPTAR